MASSSCAPSWMLGVAKSLRVEDVRAQSDFAGDFLADGHLVAGDHLHARRPFPCAVAMVCAESSRGGSKSGSTPRNCHAPRVIGARHAQGAKAARGEFVDRLLHRRLHCVAFAASARITCGAPLLTLKLLAVRRFSHRLRCACSPDRTAGNAVTSKAAQRVLVLQAAKHGQVDRVLILRARRQRGGEDHVIRVSRRRRRTARRASACSASACRSCPSTARPCRPAPRWPPAG